MKKTIMICLLIMTLVTISANDFNDGYLQGFSDAQNGFRNKVLEQRKSTSGIMGDWKVRYYVDSFKEPTEEGYALLVLDGAYSNRNLQNGKVKGYLVVDDDAVTIKLFENGERVVTGNKNNPTQYLIEVKADGKIYEFTANNYSDRLFVEDEDDDKVSFESLLKREGIMKMRISESVSFGYASTYYFDEVDAYGFREANSSI